MTNSTPSEFVAKLIAVLKANPGKAYTFKDLAAEAGVEPKTGYLSGVRKALGANFTNGEPVEVQRTVIDTVKTYIYNE